MSPDLRSLNAAGEIKSANIHVQNIEAFDALAQALGNDDLRKIEARDVAIRFSIKDGRITTQPFDLKMGGVNINLAGSTGLDQTIDYKARVAVPGGKTLQSVGVNIGIAKITLRDVGEAVKRPKSSTSRYRNSRAASRSRKRSPNRLKTSAPRRSAPARNSSPPRAGTARETRRSRGFEGGFGQDRRREGRG